MTTTNSYFECINMFCDRCCVMGLFDLTRLRRECPSDLGKQDA